jgi:hypothetical protein
VTTCNLELSALTRASERCGCGAPAGEHRHWKHRPRTVLPPPPIEQGLETYPSPRDDARRLAEALTALDAERQERMHVHDRLVAAQAHTIDRASTVDLVLALAERLLRRKVRTR